MGLRGTLAWLLALGHLGDRANVLLGGAAASADEVQPAVIYKFFKLRRKRRRRLQVFALFVRQTCIRIARNVLAR